ncbi:MAG: PQQ-binding-like beta-propeller repeat protein [Alphaproteobacteria bacterium]|nr:PQQ-binding-like beta-propeller repeat protein [Alphaproteobacteria bacterium]
MKQIKSRLNFLLLALPLLVVACTPAEKSLEGERISVLSFEQNISPDPRVQEGVIRVPPSFRNSDWANPGGFASHAAYHLALANTDPYFSVPMVGGNTRNRRMKSPPVVGGGKVFAMGAALDVVAVDANSGEHLWEQSLVPVGKRVDSGFGGGVAYGDGRVFVTTGFGEIIALSATTGEVIWRKQNNVPFSNAPTIRSGRLYVVARDSRLQVLSTTDGSFVWEYSAIAESASILSASSPAVSEQIVVVGFSSGEVSGLRSLNGTRAWEDTLSGRARQITPLSELNAIVGRPVIDRDRAFAVSHGGRMISLDIRTGERIWTADIGSAETPWVMGDYILVMSLEGQVICLSREQGRVRWVQTPDDFTPAQKPAAFWTAPILAGGRILITSSRGEIVALDPADGAHRETINLNTSISVSPVVANNTLYILANDGRLIARR